MSVAVLVHAEVVTAEIYDAVTANLGDDAPEGCLVQVAGPATEGGFRIFGVWESSEHYDRFRQERLLPAIIQATGETPSGPPATEVYEVHDMYVRE